MVTTALFISHRANAGKRDELKSVWLKPMALAIQANGGHLTYVFSYDTHDENVVSAIQQYASEYAATEFLKHSSHLAYMEKSRPLLEREPEIKLLAQPWSKTA